MSTELALALSTDMLWTAILISAPVLGLSLLVGLLISIFQVVTQIQEMSLTFIPKIITVALTIIVLGPWMLGVLVEYARSTISNITVYF